MYKHAIKNNSRNKIFSLNGLAHLNHYDNLVKFLIFAYLLQSVKSSLPTDYLSYYPLQCDMQDYGSFNLDGSAYGDLTCSPGPFDSSSAYYFNGNSSIYGSCSYCPTDEHTISVWFNPDRYTTSDDRGLSLFSYGIGSRSATAIILNPKTVTGRNVMYMLQYDGFKELIYRNAPISLNTWQHWAMTTNNAGTKLYLNGNLVASNSYFMNNIQVIGSLFSIGSLVPPLGISGTSYADYWNARWSGSLGYLMLFSRALSNNEITQIYKNTPPILRNNRFIVNLDRSISTTITSAMLSAIDTADQQDSLIFTVSNLENGYFHLTTTQAGASTTTFTQQQIQAGYVQFIPDGSKALPTFQVKVSDGLLWTAPVSANIAAQTLQPTPQPTYLRSSSPSFSPTLFKAQTSEKQNGYAMQWYIAVFGSTISGLLVLSLAWIFKKYIKALICGKENINNNQQYQLANRR